MIIIYIWFYAMLLSPVVIILYCTSKNKTMTWRDFAWWIYGVIFGIFPFYVAIVQHMKLKEVLNMNEFKEIKNNYTSYDENFGLTPDQVEWMIETLCNLENSIKNVLEYFESKCGTYDKPRRMTLEEIFEVYQRINEIIGN